MSDYFPPKNFKTMNLSRVWEDTATKNVDIWGRQDMDTLLLAMQEELGELTRAYLQWTHEDGEPRPVADELHDLAPLLFQFYWELDATTDSDRRGDAGDE